jgi:acetyltransferase-like isoleucine patch superfamily enzyme
MIYEPVLILKPEMVEIHPTARIDQWVRIEGGYGVEICQHVHIASFCTINSGGGAVYFGKHSGCACGVRICGGMPDLSYLHISAAEDERNKHNLRRQTVIGEYVVIFSNAVICPGVTVGDGAVIGAGSVVTKDVPPYAVMVGNPARFHKWRVVKDECLLMQQLSQ